MIAAFLKNVDGDFNYPAAAMSLFLLCSIAACVVELRRCVRRDRILFAWSLPPYGDSGRFWIERETHPFGFWFVYVLYCLSIIIVASLILVICFGLLRKPG